ncbi:reverse transcriptase, partial [Globisporangium splendens]
MNDGAIEINAPTVPEAAHHALVVNKLDIGMRNLHQLLYTQPADSDTLAAAFVTKGFMDTLLADSSPPLLSWNSQNGMLLLFFDGGSRGNPGGSCSVLVKVHPNTHSAAIMWIASMSYSSPDTTNSVTEYWGLIHGLRYPQAHRLELLHITGDSALIVSQQRLHRLPKNNRLANLYCITRRIADTLCICSWNRHYRVFNRMDDAAVKHAVNTRESQQASLPSDRPLIHQVTPSLSNDTLHWIQHHADDPRVQDNNKHP